jgi:hypothetical protein
MRPHGAFQGNILRGFARIIVATVGGCSIAWAVFAYPTLRHETAFAAAAHRILSGEQYSASELSNLRSELDASSDLSFRPSALSDVAVVRLRLVEAALASGQPPAVDLDRLQQSIDAALAHNPPLSFLWLTDYWLQQIRRGSAGADLGLLRMSYLTGPNEGWIAVKRSPLALGVFGSLPDELQSRVIAEFAGLVRSWLFQDAANILAGPGWPVRQRLLDGLAQLSEGHRRGFAGVLEAGDVEDVVIPGVEQRSHQPH